MTIKRRTTIIQRIKTNQEIDRCRKMTPEELYAFLRSKYEEF
jgi:hypothetical protein